LSEAGGPDLTAVNAAVATVLAWLRPGMTVILESTTYPGTTEELVRPVIESRGLRVGSDVHLAFSPERIDPGRTDFGAKNTPKVVGGCTPGCTAAAAAFYGRFVDTVVTVKGTREAEMAKLLENTYRHVNIALVNEMAMFCHELDIDLWESIRAAATKPFGFQAFYPGPGVGGHCIPIDPNYLSHRVRAKLKHSFRFVELAQDINAQMPSYVVLRAAELLNDHSKALRGSRVLLLGVTYKPDIADQRESPAVDVARIFEAKGAIVSFHDPFVQDWRLNGHSLACVQDLETATREADLVVLLQQHRAYDIDRLAHSAALFFDTRGRAADAENVARL
ncbi:MAG: nucleotide sugar dehydrogenase, partial [Micrococcales bacterium]|nr:nucleotide sugar dehydrogenase [Micrococcales bacterium]